jgi:hypothetical protein
MLGGPVDHRLGNEAVRSEEMDENGRSYWEVVQERHFELLLAMELVEIGGRVKDAAAFKEAYDSEVKDFMMRHGKYEWPDYDESEAQDMHKSLVESGTIIDYIMWGRLSRRNYVLDGPEGARERERATAMQRMTAVVVWDQDSRKLVGSALTGASDMEDGSG